MTEAEWLACDEPASLLQCLVRRFAKISYRKMHLFGCACCRRIWHLLGDPCSRHAVELAERYADGLATRRELAVARKTALTIAGVLRKDIATKAGFDRAARAAALCAQSNGMEAGRTASHDAAKAAGDAAYFGTGGAAVHPDNFWHLAIKREEREQASLLRDIFGNPFRLTRISPAWLTWQDGTVPKIAQTISGELAFEQLSVLADALEEAGCADGELLGHCRKPGTHVRGCWALDALLDRE